MKLPATFSRTSNFNDPMQKYRVAIAAIGLLVIALVALNVFGTIRQRADYAVEKEVDRVRADVDSYISRQKKAPATFADATASKAEHGVEYFKLSEERYSICATYKTKSSGYVSPSSTFTDSVISEGLKAGINNAEGASFYDASRQGGSKHEKGYSCAVYTPYMLSAAYLRPHMPCKGKPSYEMAESYKYIRSTDETAATITYSSSVGGVQVQTYPSIYTGAATLVTLPYEKNMPVYSLGCANITLKDIKSTDRVTIYTDKQKTIIKAVKIGDGSYYNTYTNPSNID